MEEKFKDIIETLKEDENIIFAYLFGSQIKGYANEKSDWDIAIYFVQNLKDKSLWYPFELEAKLAYLLKKEVQVVILNDITKPTFLFHIINEGILLVDKEKKLRLEFEMKVMRDYYDWKFFVNRYLISG